MNAKSSANTMPLEQDRKRERAGEHILFNARARSKLAKQEGNALSDLAHRDVERAGRYPAPAAMGTGGELVPGDLKYRCPFNIVVPRCGRKGPVGHKRVFRSLPAPRP
jgi:hypothetical protein